MSVASCVELRINKIIATFAPRKTGYSAVRLAHLLWEQGVGSSNLSTPTIEGERVRLFESDSFFYWFELGLKIRLLKRDYRTRNRITTFHSPPAIA